MKKYLISISIFLLCQFLYSRHITYAAYDFLPYQTGSESGAVFCRKVKSDLFYHKSHYKLFLFRCGSQNTKKINLHHEYIPILPKISDDQSILFFYSMIESKDHISVIDLANTKREIVSFNTSGYFISGNPCNIIQLNEKDPNTRQNNTVLYLTGAIFKRGAPLFSRSAYLIDISNSDVKEIKQTKGLENIFFNQKGSCLYLIEKQKDQYKIEKTISNQENLKIISQNCLYYQYFSKHKILVYLKRKNIFVYDEIHDITLQFPIPAENFSIIAQNRQNVFFQIYKNTLVIYFNHNLFFYKLNKGLDNKCVLPLGQGSNVYFYPAGLSILKDYKLYSFTVKDIETDNVELKNCQYTKIPVWMKQIEILDYNYGFLLDEQQIWILKKYNEIIPTAIKNINRIVKTTKMHDKIFLLLQKNESEEAIYQGLYYLSQHTNKFTDISHIPGSNLAVSTFNNNIGHDK